MGKTVGAILAIAAIVAINFIPGVGQAVTGALVSAGLAAGTAATITTILTSVVTAAALSAASMLLFAPSPLKQPETAATPLKVSTPPRVSAYGEGRLFGAYILFVNTDYSLDSDTFAPWALDAYAVHDGPIDSIVYRYLGDDRITLGAPSGHGVEGLPNNQYGGPTTDRLVRWYETLGETPGTANWAEFIAKVPTHWDTNHRGDGVVCLGIVWRPVSADEFSERFPQGAAPASIVARWQKVYDPRDGAQDVSDPDTWVWSENAVLHLLHYRLVREKARRTPGASLPTALQLQDAWDLFFEPTRSYWEEAADVCDEAVPLKAGGTEARYRSRFAHKHTDPHKDIIDALTQCFDGWTSPRSDGALVVYAGKFYEPTVSIGPAEIVSYSWQYGVIDEESVNELKITYISDQHDYNVVDADPWRDDDDMLERGAIRTVGIDFPVPSHSQARRLAKRKMARVMSSNRGIVTTNIAGRIVRGQRYINLTIEEAGATFFDGVAEITQMIRNMKTGGITFSWVEVTSTIDAWEEETEEGDPAPVKDAITLVQPDAPVIDTAGLVFDQSADSGTGARIIIDLSGPSGTDLVWYARWRRVGDAIWNEQRYTDVDSSSGVELITGFVPVDKTLEVEVAYRSGTGALSPYSTPATEVDTDTEVTAPDAATAPTLVDWSDKIVMVCDAIARAKSYRWRFYLSDGTTLKRTVTTTGPSAQYSKAEAHADGVDRDYKVDVAGVNAAGTGTVSSKTAISNAAPAAPTSVVFADGTSTSSATFTASVSADAVGYVVAYSTTTGFDPMTEGASFQAAVSPAYTGQLAAASYFGKIASFDLWTSQPDKINFSGQDAFTITPGSGGTPPAGGGGGGFTGGGGGGGRVEP